MGRRGNGLGFLGGWWPCRPEMGAAGPAGRPAGPRPNRRGGFLLFCVLFFFCSLRGLLLFQSVVNSLTM